MIRKYRLILKEKGWKGLVKDVGWTAAILMFAFFLIKGLVWLALLYGGIKWYSS